MCRLRKMVDEFFLPLFFIVCVTICVAYFVCEFFKLFFKEDCDNGVNKAGSRVDGNGRAIGAIVCEDDVIKRTNDGNKCYEELKAELRKDSDMKSLELAYNDVLTGVYNIHDPTEMTRDGKSFLYFCKVDLNKVNYLDVDSCVRHVISELKKSGLNMYNEDMYDIDYHGARDTFWSEVKRAVSSLMTGIQIANNRNNNRNGGYKRKTQDWVSSEVCDIDMIGHTGDYDNCECLDRDWSDYCRKCGELSMQFGRNNVSDRKEKYYFMNYGMIVMKPLVSGSLGSSRVSRVRGVRSGVSGVPSNEVLIGIGLYFDKWLEKDSILSVSELGKEDIWTKEKMQGFIKYLLVKEIENENKKMTDEMMDVIIEENGFELYQWLSKDSVGHLEYYNNFKQAGFEKLRAIATIEKDTLTYDLGIGKIGHAADLFVCIQELNKQLKMDDYY